MEWKQSWIDRIVHEQPQGIFPGPPIGVNPQQICNTPKAQTPNGSQFGLHPQSFCYTSSWKSWKKACSQSFVAEQTQFTNGNAWVTMTVFSSTQRFKSDQNIDEAIMQPICNNSRGPITLATYVTSLIYVYLPNEKNQKGMRLLKTPIFVFLFGERYIAVFWRNSTTSICRSGKAVHDCSYRTKMLCIRHFVWRLFQLGDAAD
jgi:hypothetical protein